jgi:ABC-2 type transport system permease protein
MRASRYKEAREMKQFGKILKFELQGYLKNKMFVGITLFLVAAIAVVMFIPNITAFFSEGETPDVPGALPVMVIHSEDEGLALLVKEYFSATFEGYDIVISEGSVDDVKSQIISGEAECAFVMNSAASYTYYVNNLSMYDTNTAIASSVLTEVYRINAMIQNGLSPEQAGNIMSVTIESSTFTLGKDQMENFLYTYLMILALYMVIMLYGQMVATNVATEKSSRAMEVLITSANPTSMMFGKVIASCIAGLTQLVAIFGSALVFYNANKSAWGDNELIQSIFNIPVNLFAYMIVFFALGFLIYAFLYGAIGSTASKLEDINTSVMPITFLFIIGFMVVMFSMAEGNVDSMLMKVCSYVPFTSPMAMFTRICMSTVAWYEIAASVAILALTTVGIGFVSAKIYRVGVLLYGTPPKLSTILKTVFKKS